MRFTAKLTALALSALMMLSVAGCSRADTWWAFESEGEQMPVGVFIRYMLDAYREAEEIYMEDSDEVFFAHPDQRDVLRHTIEGRPAGSWVTDRAVVHVLRHYGTAYMYSQMGLSMSQSEIDAVEASIQDVWNIVSEFYESNGISRNSLEWYFWNQMMRQQLFFELYGPGGDFEVPESEVLAAFASENFGARFILVPKDQEGEEDEIAELAAQSLERLNAGEPLNVVEFDVRQVVMPPEFEIALGDSDINTMILPYHELEFLGHFGDAIQAAPTDSFIMVEGEREFFIVRRLDLAGNAEYMGDNWGSVLFNLKFDEFLDKLEEWGEAVGPTANQEALRRYTVDRLNTDITSFLQA